MRIQKEAWGVVAACVSLLSAGCVDATVTPISPPPTTVRVCATSNISAIPVTDKVWQFVAVRRRDAPAKAGSLGILLVDDPQTETMVWQPGSAWAASVDAIDTDIAGAVGAGAESNLDNVNYTMSNNPELNVTDVVYLAQAIQQFTISFTCNYGDGLALGTWTGPVGTETGILTCGLDAPAQGAVMFAQARAQFCP